MRAEARYAPFVLLAPASALSALASLAACDTLPGAIQPPAIATVAPEPLTPVAVPTLTMKGGKGAAEAATALVSQPSVRYGVGMNDVDAPDDDLVTVRSAFGAVRVAREVRVVEAPPG